MKVGVPTEIKTDEFRVAITPAGVRELTSQGHEVLIQAGAGVGSAIDDLAYEAQGARIVPDGAAVWGEAELVLKVKEPQRCEVPLLRPGQTLFTYLHLAAEPELAAGLCASGATCIAYETVEDARGRLPLLAPMSEVAGKIATQAGAFMLERPLGGRGLLLGGVAGVAPGKVVVIGGGIVGYNAAVIALGLGASVTILERSIDRMRHLEEVLGARVTLLMSSSLQIEESVADADLVVGAVLIPGALAPKLVTRETLRGMKEGVVLCDVAIDQGGIAETSRPTTHTEPVYEVEGVVHYCVANMPGAVPRTSTFALTNATLPYALRLANRGFVDAINSDPGLKLGVNTYAGKLTYEAVAESQGLAYTPLDEVLTGASASTTSSARSSS